MSLNQTVSGERLHIGFFGKRNAGKSSLVNAVTGQELSVVSDVAGTTTDPVKKAMELFPVGPVLIIDTPGFDDIGELGEKRVEKTLRTLASTDLAVLVVDGTVGFTQEDEQVLSVIKERGIPFAVVYTKSDLGKANITHEGISVSSQAGENIDELKTLLGKIKTKKQEKYILKDLISPGDTVVLVMPIDESAPKGRLILPQQQTLRELLDLHCIPVCCQDTEVKATLAALKNPPKLVITDSQAFGRVSKDVPDEVMLTSFSILFARYKGDLLSLVSGAKALKGLKDGDKVLISEGCTHHRQCGDIGSVKIPAWIRKYTNAEPELVFSSGNDFPKELSKFSLVIHCGGCMLNETEMAYRMSLAKQQGIPMVNYGVAIACMNGILKRSLQPFPNVLKMLD